MSTNFEDPVTVVTGATAGVGLPLAIGLARAGRALLLGVRDPARGDRAAAAVRATVPGARVAHAPLDLASLASVRAFAGGLAGARVDLLVLNAAVMVTSRRETQDGLELMLGTNAVAHAALAGLLLPELHRTPGARIVAQSSEAHRHGRLDLHDLQSTRARAIAAYNASKLALHVLAVELDRRSGIPTVVAQPGWVASELGRDVAASGSAGQRALLAVGNRLIGQTPEEGARAALRAALAPDVPGAATGRYVTPGGLARLRGTPRIADADPRVLDPRLGAGLGRWVEDVTGVALAAPAPAGGRA